MKTQDLLGALSSSEPGLSTGTHVLARHHFNPTIHQVRICSSGLHPTDLNEFQTEIESLVANGWTLNQLVLVTTPGVGGATVLAVLAKPRSQSDSAS